VRATADLDVWIEISDKNAAKMVAVLTAFGFGVAALSAEIFAAQGRIVRMGNPPMRVEILNDISGVRFAQCYRHRTLARIDGIQVNVIGRDDLIRNKQPAGAKKISTTWNTSPDLTMNGVQHALYLLAPTAGERA